MQSEFMRKTFTLANLALSVNATWFYLCSLLHQGETSSKSHWDWMDGAACCYWINK